MALHLEEVPEFCCTINLVPSLLAQLEAYVERRDRHPSELARADRPTAWTPDDACYVLDNFFMANPDTMIRPHPRYHELYTDAIVVEQLGQGGTAPVPRRATCATSRSGRTWPGSTPCSSRRTRELAEFKAKGRHYTEDEKQWFLDKQRELVARVIPLHRELAARGQIELTTTPYYHPILPLLIDKTRHARRCPT